jgi:type VI secretion system protein ImpG
VERLLEGTASDGMLRQKLVDEFPEVIHGLMSLIFPHYLNPIPAATIVAFAPKPSLKENLVVPAGVQLASVPVDGAKCLFSTCYDVTVSPLALTGATLARAPGQPAVVVVVLELNGLALDNWPPADVRLQLPGRLGEAAALFYILTGRCRRVVVSAREGGSPLFLEPDDIRRWGFPTGKHLSLSPQFVPGYRLLQNISVLPEKFLFFDVPVSRWAERGGDSRFRIMFELDDPSTAPAQVRADQFVLFAAPAVNLFPYDAEPITWTTGSRNTDHPRRRRPTIIRFTAWKAWRACAPAPCET